MTFAAGFGAMEAQGPGRQQGGAAMVEGVFPILLLVLALTAGAAGIDRALRAGDGENLFWAGLTAFLAVLLIAAWASTATDAGAAAAGSVVVGGSIAAALWVARRDRRRRLIREDRQVQAELHAVAARHEEVLARWRAYELDPWLAAEHPQLLDVRAPETRNFIRALKAAEQLRPEAGKASDAAAYAQAVGRLEDSFRRAETAAGGGRAA
ncbi:hypothetical protein [Arthrobacter sp. zg-Y877]|uniref:hypothetical protein n=1 Tax=Arthrobacter sp. zg-Y877 TaxID=3049074 RepID=UPI0025A4B2BB|nr:hypothetical protein [Arthrobacter sp. zg-Y877]MDM7991006.1 hypothetical protein [Arthrobacter sp. zg-Y877]